MDGGGKLHCDLKSLSPLPTSLCPQGVHDERTISQGAVAKPCA